jgi:hypothetical protein
MRQKSRLVLPSDPEYTTHRDAQKRRQETREWLLRRERASIAPPMTRRKANRTGAAHSRADGS